MKSPFSRKVTKRIKELTFFGSLEYQSELDAQFWPWWTSNATTPKFLVDIVGDLNCQGIVSKMHDEGVNIYYVG